jgi:hypothetical protein
LSSTGAGLYSFFKVILFFSNKESGLIFCYQSYSEDCNKGGTCQSQIVNIDTESTIHIYSLSTVGVTFQISVEGKGIMNQAANENGFASTVTSWNP